MLENQYDDMLAELEREEAALLDRLPKVRRAIEGIIPLSSRGSIVQRRVASPEAPTPGMPVVVTGKSAALRGLTARICSALADAGRPLKVREMADAVGFAPDDARKIPDLLYRRSEDKTLFDRIAKGVYALRVVDRLSDAATATTTDRRVDVVRKSPGLSSGQICGQMGYRVDQPKARRVVQTMLGQLVTKMRLARDTEGKLHFRETS